MDEHFGKRENLFGINQMLFRAGLLQAQRPDFNSTRLS